TPHSIDGAVVSRARRWRPRPECSGRWKSRPPSTPRWRKSPMNRPPTHSSDVLLARVNRELEEISDLQHRLARRKAVLQNQATRLRLGASPLEVGFALQASARMEEDERNFRLDAEWTFPEDGRERLGF